MSPDEITMRDLMDASLRAIDANVYGLREQLITFQNASTREHGEVRADLAEVRAQLGRVPTDDELRTFKNHVYARLEPLERDLHERTGGARTRASIGRIIVAGCSAGGAVFGVIVVIARLLIPA